MSVKEKLEKSKKPSDVRSLRQEKSAQSVSNLSSHIGQLRRNGQKLEQGLRHATHKIRFHEQMRDQYIDRTDQFSREVVEDAEEEIQLWKEKLRQIKTQLKNVDEQLRNVYGSPQNPRKPQIHALKKVKEPPSDNE